MKLNSNFEIDFKESIPIILIKNNYQFDGYMGKIVDVRGYDIIISEINTKISHFHTHSNKKELINNLQKDFEYIYKKQCTVIQDFSEY